MSKSALYAEALEQIKKRDSVSEEMAAFFVGAMQHHASRYMEAMAPKVKLSDGRLGYRGAAESEVTFVAGKDPLDPNAPRETIIMRATQSEVCPSDPVFTLDGRIRVDLEIYAFEMEGVSKVVFGNNVPIKMSAGVGGDRYSRPSLGSFSFPMTQTFGTVPVESVQKVFVSVQTPDGLLINHEPARMVAQVTQVPPVNVAYVQDGIVPLFDSAGNQTAAKVSQTTRLTGLSV